MIYLTENRAIEWYCKNTVYVKGYCSDKQNKLHTGESLSEYFSKFSSLTELENLLKEANGIYSVIIQEDNRTIIAMDRSRIYPLFYAFRDKEIMVADNPYSLLPYSGKELNYLATTEIKHAGYALGNKTIFKDIFQLQPSSYLIFEDGKTFSCHYDSYITDHEVETSFDAAQQALEEQLNNTFSRLINSLNGRQIVIPLSGGYDSRLIATQLTRLGYSNIICYNVGRPQNPEMILSKKVANVLNLKYYFIDTSDPELIHEYSQTPLFNEYFHFSGFLCSTFWMYEYFGVKYLIDNNLIDKNAVFIPGHSGDFLAGSQITKAGIPKNISTTERLKCLIRDKFTLNLSNEKTETRKNLEAEVFTYSSKEGLGYSVYENFDFCEKLPKFINNSCRLYEFFGHEVRLPFWDNELVGFFRQLPYRQKMNKILYDDYLEKQLFAPLSVRFDNEIQPPGWYYKFQILKNKIKSRIPSALIRKISNAPDYTCMKEISAPLKKDLILNNIATENTYNEIFAKWYLLKIGEYFK